MLPMRPSSPQEAEPAEGVLTAPRLQVNPTVARARAIFLSDFHLGTVGCKAAELLDFLRRHEAETTYLAGDIFDNWRPLGGHWNDDHERIVKLLIGRARSGQRIIYLPGNHDEFFLRYPGRYFVDLEILPEAWHITASGNRLLVTHGDGCDVFARRLPVLARAGSWIEAGVRRLDWATRATLRSLGMPEWNGIDRGLARVNGLVRAHDRFEERLCDLALYRGADGIVCGHFHKPALHRDHGVLYANCGDWVENCSALVEEDDGALSLVNWRNEQAICDELPLPGQPEAA